MPDQSESTRVAALHDLAPEDIRLLQSVALTRTYADGEALCKQGEPGACCFLLLQGEVEVLRNVTGRTLSIARIGAGDMIGQLSLLDGSPRAATIVARGEVTAMVLMRDVFERLLRAHSAVALRFQRRVAVAGVRQLRSATQQLAALMLHDPPDAGDAGLRRRNSAVTAMTALSELSIDISNLASVRVIEREEAPPGEVQAPTAVRRVEP